ncbi:MAG: hypothetical protein KF730_16290 [Sphingomonas sp.]|uniref:hypothetical protein n=1 Tax=Sphingomonas sp. TaxID=28214 RepID=UPI0025DA1056|nr:hypothetical protein [Sphingomonas sp.]MBX3566120.1 hypothetical protein [Sphingomonas sp.]
MADEPFGFFLRRRVDGKFSGFAYGTKLDDLRKIGDPPVKEEEKPKDSSDGEAALPQDETHPLEKLMKEAVASGLSQFDLIWVSAGARTLFANAFMENEVLTKVDNHCKKFEETEKYTIWTVPEDTYFEIAESHDQLKQLRRGLETLPAAVLMNMVATFDSTVVEIIRSMFTLKSELFKELDRSVDVKDILSVASLEELQGKIIDQEVYKFSRGSHDEQTAFIEKNFHVEIRKSWKRWADFIEIFERRNLIAHGEKEFNNRYSSICQSNGHSGSEKLLGEKIELRREYLAQSCDILIEFSVLLIFSLWKKHYTADEEKAFDQINDTIFNLIGRGRYMLATRLSEYVLSLKGTKMTELVRRMIIVNNASAYRHAGNRDKSDKVLNEVDWSAASDNFKICVAALKDDMDEVERVMPLVIQADSIEKSSFRSWPVFKFAREDKRFQDAFEKAFGEALLRGKIEAKDSEGDVAQSDGMKEGQQVSGETSEDIKTVH